MKIQKYILEITVFTCGAVVMIFELVGSRVLGPYFGTSIFVWTSLIGIILGSLSFGYYFGGKVADKNTDILILSSIIFMSAFFMGLTTFIKEPLLNFIQTIPIGIKSGAISSAVILFAPVSVLLGMVSPYAVKLKLNDLNTSGRTIGNLYALSTLGSIIGTFLSGFYLIPSFGTNKLLILLTIILLLIAILLSKKWFLKTNSKMLLIIIFGFIFASNINYASGKDNFIDIDTAYNRIWIYDHQDSRSNKMVKTMGINNENHSSMFLDSDELVSEYTKYYHLASHFYPNFNKTLLFGGAGYSFPKNFLIKYKEASIDVVEIDPQITELAKKYFRLKDDPRLNIYHQDGRIFLNNTKNKYDVIFGDAFGSRYSIPYQLTTKEAVEKEYNILNDKGIIIQNIISAVEGKKGEFLRAEYATYKEIFPQVYVFLVNNKDNGYKVQNLMLVALKSTDIPTFIDSDPQLNEYLNHLWKNEIVLDMPILTDDFAPVDYYINKTLL